ncbi:tRNA lysidine(34) synthetase TilS [Synechococcales cyanobacterium C]|uniref:tRNA(Ile)-lysidine synthase n=1 Tax=Petrachloros mirabilis ULC683 TaxID=2781853 RepID=A0A8K2A065_9CYAN|nr:tRNA lysidine(34) synthetase TilS [Petrachloros mirabilis]NCJ07022.1 tRNA lysidine(34) synthetase TilS [Petrachloros mirabilis ULC683]
MRWTPLHAHFDQGLRQRNLLPRSQPVLLAFSGGQDSLCLLRLLLDLQPKWGWQLGVAHCDHRWPPDSTANATYVSALVQAWNLPLYVRMAPAVLKTEAAGRDWRYGVLRDLAETEGYPTVVTAHTASDRAETLLYNLVRGSGMEGLQALTWQRSLSATVSLVRPLLNVTRAQTGAFCTALSLSPWQDSMNQDLAYRRNRMRQQVLPLLRSQFNPQVDRALARTAELLQADVAYLDGVAQACLKRALPAAHPDPPQHPALHRPTLRRVPLALQRRVVRQFLQTEVLAAPNFDQVETVVALLDAPQRSRTAPLVANWIAEVQRDWLCLIALAGEVIRST